MIAAAASGALAAFGVLLMARGARREARGRLEDARRLGRRGGFLALAGALGLGFASPTLWSLALALAAGVVALLGGLSGKPRPAWWIAAIALGLAGLGYTSRPP